MGNAASSTQATPPPINTNTNTNICTRHKLSKPRVRTHACPTTHLLSSNATRGHRRIDSRKPVGELSIEIPPSQFSRIPVSEPNTSPTLRPRKPPPGLDGPCAPSPQPNLTPHRRSNSTPAHLENKTREQFWQERASLTTTRKGSLLPRSQLVVYGGDARTTSRKVPNDDRVLFQQRELVEPSNTKDIYDPGPVMSQTQYGLADNTWKSSHPSLQPSSPRGTGADSFPIYAPVRRRSVIRTPGVATRIEKETPRRANTTKESRLPPPPIPEGGRDRGGPSPSGNLALPSRTGQGQERAVTPSDTEYRQLGAMKFGSLRITNGAPSPGSERLHRLRGSGEAFAPGNGSTSSLDDRSGLKTTSTTKIIHPTPISKTISPLTATFLKLESRGSDRPQSSANNVDGNAVAFLPGFSFGSLSFLASRTPSPVLHTTSKLTALEDNLFDDDSIFIPSEPPNAKGNNRDVINSRGQRGRAGLTSKSLQALDRPDSGFVSSPTSEYPYKPFSKTDSGYSSNVSLRSLRNSKGSAAADKELPPRPGESPQPEPVTQEAIRTSFLGDVHIFTSASLFDDLIPAAPDREAPPPPPPPKDAVGLSRSDTVSGKPTLRKTPSPPPPPAKRQNSTRQAPMSLLVSKMGLAGPLSPNSIQLSPGLSDISSSRGGAEKQGTLMRLLSVTSRRRSGNSRRTRSSFRSSGSSLVTRDSAGTPVPPAKLTKNDRPSGASRLVTMETAYDEEARQPTPHELETSHENAVRKRRSFQSIPASIAASVLTVRKSFRRSTSPNVDDEVLDDLDNRENVQAVVNGSEVGSGASVSGSDTASNFDYGRDNLIRNGFDPSFVAMSSERDAYFPPAPSRAPSRTGSVASSSDDIRLAAFRARSNAGSPASFYVGEPGQVAYMEDGAFVHPAPTLTRAHSVIQLRVPPTLRPGSRNSNLRRAKSQSLLDHTSHAVLYSYPAPLASSSGSVYEGMTPAPEARPRMPEQAPTPAPARQQNDPISSSTSDRGGPGWTPRRTNSQHSRASSISSRASSSEPYTRSASANPYSEYQRPILQRPSTANPYSSGQQRQGHPQLRHRASYESQGGASSSSSASKGWGGGGFQSYRRQSPDLWTSTHYQQLQMQYGGTALDPSGGRFPPYVPRPGHYKNRSVTGGRQTPYRVLHSYNSPAYKHVPIWG